MDSRNVYIKCNPYDLNEVRGWDHAQGRFKYKPKDWDLVGN